MKNGPTHKPIKTIPSLRAMAFMLVFRTSDGNKISGAKKQIILNRNRPSSLSLSLSRQSMANQANYFIKKVELGGYEHEDCAGTPI